MRDSVRWFASRMENNLRANDEVKGAWEGGSPEVLYSRLLDEVMELHQAICDHGDKGQNLAQQVIDEAVDVANFAMMIASTMDSLVKTFDRGRIVRHQPDKPSPQIQQGTG